MNTKEFRNACGSFATGVTVICSKKNHDIHGMTANGFMSVSLEPPLIVVSIGKNQKMHDIILESQRYSVNILGADQQNVSNQFAGKPNPDLNIDFLEDNHIPILKHSAAFFTAKVQHVYDGGDHTLFVAEVLNFGVSSTQKPLLFYKGQYNTIN